VPAALKRLKLGLTNYRAEF